MHATALILIASAVAGHGRRTERSPRSARERTTLQSLAGYHRPHDAVGAFSTFLLASNPAAARTVGVRPRVAQRRKRLDMTTTVTADTEAVATAAPKTPSIRQDLAAAMGTEPASKMNANEEELIAKANFPIPPDELISLAKAFTAAQIAGTADGGGGNPDWFASDFRFVAPVVGPMDKDEFVDSLKSFEIEKAFPDISSNYHHWRVDPFEPNRVWYSVKYIGTNSGPVLGQPATNKYVESPVQAHSVTFNEKGEVTKFTIGYVLDKEVGNTGGLGGVFGLFYAIGLALPFPEANPYQPSPLYGALMQSNKVIQNIQKSNPAFKQIVQGIVTTLGKRD